MFDPAAAIHTAVLRYIRLLGTTAADGSVLEADGLLSISSELPIANGNQVLVTERNVTDVALIAAVDRMRSAGRPFRVMLRSGLDDRSRPALGSGRSRLEPVAGSGAPSGLDAGA